MFFNVVILKFILMITAPYVFQRCDFDLIGDDCKKPIVAKNPLQKKQDGFFATEIYEVGFLQRFSLRQRGISPFKNKGKNDDFSPYCFWNEIVGERWWTQLDKYQNETKCNVSSIRELGYHDLPFLFTRTMKPMDVCPKSTSDFNRKRSGQIVAFQWVSFNYYGLV